MAKYKSSKGASKLKGIRSTKKSFIPKHTVTFKKERTR